MSHTSCSSLLAERCETEFDGPDSSQELFFEGVNTTVARYCRRERKCAFYCKYSCKCNGEFTKFIPSKARETYSLHLAYGDQRVVLRSSSRSSVLLSASEL